MAKKKTSPKKTAKPQSASVPAPAKKATPAKSAAVTEVPATEVPAGEEKKPRRVQPAKYNSFRLQKRIKHDTPKVLGGFKLFKQALRMIKDHWKVFLGITFIYAMLNVVLVQSFAGLDVYSSKATLENVFTGQWSKVLSGFSIFAYLVGSSTATGSQTAAAYQFMLVLITSLASIWVIRHAYQNIKVRIRDAYYMGMYPLIPFVLVLGVVIIQLLPIIVGSFLYGFAGKGGVLTGAEMALWLGAIFMLSVLSLYLISSSLFALYIVCLPDMTPMHALRSARALVKNRRWMVMRRILFLPLILLIVGGLVMVPVIMLITPLAVGLFFALTVLVVPVAHAYMYRLYRELL